MDGYMIFSGKSPTIGVSIKIASISVLLSKPSSVVKTEKSAANFAPSSPYVTIEVMP